MHDLVLCSEYHCRDNFDHTDDPRKRLYTQKQRDEQINEVITKKQKQRTRTPGKMHETKPYKRHNGRRP